MFERLQQQLTPRNLRKTARASPWTTIRREKPGHFKLSEQESQTFRTGTRIAAGSLRLERREGRMGLVQWWAGGGYLVRDFPLRWRPLLEGHCNHNAHARNLLPPLHLWRVFEVRLAEERIVRADMQTAFTSLTHERHNVSDSDALPRKPLGLAIPVALHVCRIVLPSACVWDERLASVSRTKPVVAPDMPGSSVDFADVQRI